MTTLGPTSMLDPYVEGWAKEVGMETSTLASIVGGNIIGGVIGIPIDMFLTELGAKIASSAIGLASLLLGTYSFHGQGRLQVDVMQIGSRIVTEILDPSPQQVKEIQKNVGDLIDGVVQGRWDKAVYALVRNPREFGEMLPKPAKEKTEEKEEATSEQKKTEQPTIPKGPGITHKL